MRGLLLSEFLAFSEAEYGREVADRLATGDSGRAESWNPIAAYPHQEMLSLARRLGELTDTDGGVVLRKYGARLFHRLAALYPGFLVGAQSAFTFIAGFQAAIHDELRKVHPDSEVPHIQCTAHGADRLEMVYRSPRRLGDLAEGLLRGCVEHFGEAIDIERRDVPRGPEQTVRFILLRRAGATEAAAGPPNQS
jgi:hypothetical protein